jgi:hypothetical protein
MHPRKAIRHAVVDLLIGATSAGSRVVGTRIDPNRKTQLPAISVYTLHDPVRPAPERIEPRELTRDVKVEIAGWVAHRDVLSVDDAMDDLAEQIELAMDSDRYLSGAAGESVLEGTEMEVVEQDGRSDPLVGIVVLTYSVTYRTMPSTGTFDDFLTATAVYPPVDGEPDTVPASDGPFVVQEITP